MIDANEHIPGDAFIDLAPGVRVAADAMRIQFSRSSGPGGQNVNKLNTRAELWVPLAAIIGLDPRAFGRLRVLAGRRLTAAGEVHLSAQTERSQEGNRQAVIDRLRELIVKAQVEPKRRKKTRPSKAARARRLEGKRLRGEVKARRQRPSAEW